MAQLSTALERIEPRCCRGDGSGFVTLRRLKQPRTPVLRTGKLFADYYRTFAKVHGVPGKAQQLRQAQAGKERHRGKLLHRRVSGCGSSCSAFGRVHLKAGIREI